LQAKYLIKTDKKRTAGADEYAENAAGQGTGTALLVLLYCISGAYLVKMAGLYTSAKKYQ
jgi:hypothetical protein